MNKFVLGAATGLILVICTIAGAEESGDAADWRLVYYTHYECPDLERGTPGSSPETAIDVDFAEPFDDAVDAMSGEQASETGQRSRLECRWIRLSGFMTWLDYYHYRGRFYRSPAAAYLGHETSYILEKFMPGSSARSALAQRRLNITGRFYDLCAAARRAEREAGQTWWLFGPCHYGAHNGMMLDDVTVVEVVDSEPQYMLGDANRAIFQSLEPVEGDDRTDLVRATRAWAGSLQRGSAQFLQELEAMRSPATPEDRQRRREAVESRDSYESYLLRDSRFQRLHVGSAPVEVFREANRDDETYAVGCICLTSSCTDRWPLTGADAHAFLGDAACTALWRRGNSVEGWLW